MLGGGTGIEQVVFRDARETAHWRVNVISHGPLPPSLPDDVPLITNATARRATTAERASGILAWVMFEIAGVLRVNGVTLRVTKDDQRLALSMPAPTSRSGKRVEVVRPVDAEARRALERAVIEALWRGGEVEL